MLGNCEKMVLIPSAPNEWPQNNQIDDQKEGCLSNNINNNNNMGSVGCRVMDQKVAAIPQDHQQHHQQQQQQQQQQKQQQQNQEPLRCPRCDSSNTKFCYYNNYSLSQPRHFCKACKRYWTRGGTLRNVPVGGGCRKNKRVKRPSNSSSSTANSSLDANSANSASSGGGGPHHGHNSIHDLISSASNHVNNPLFYGLPTNHNPTSDINFPFSRYDLQTPPHMNGLGLGFSSSSCGLVHNSMNGDAEFRNGLGFNLHNNNHHQQQQQQHNHPGSKQIFQDLISSHPLLSNYTTTTTTTTTNSSSSPSISSLLASSLHIKGGNNFQTLLPSYHHEDELQMKGGGEQQQGSGANGMFTKEVKMELEGQNRSMMDHHHHHWSAPSQNQMDHQAMGGSTSSDPSLMWGAGSNLGAWMDPSNNLGSSVPSLI